MFANIFIQSASLPLVEVKGSIITAIRSESVNSLGIFRGARLVRFANHEVELVGVEVDWWVGLVIGVEGIMHCDGGIPWKLGMTGTRPAFRMRWALRSSAADMVISSPSGIVLRAKMASWTTLLRCPR